MTLPEKRPSQIVIVNLLPTAFLVLGTILLWRWIGLLREVVLLLALSALLAAALNPVVMLLRNRLRFPRALGAVIAVLLLLTVVFYAGFLLFPEVVRQLNSFIKNLPELTKTLEKTAKSWTESQPLLGSVETPQFLSNISQRLGAFGVELLANATGLLGDAARVLTSAVFLVVLVVYMLAQPEPLVRGGLGLVPLAFRARVQRIAEKVLAELGAWGRAELLLMSAMGLLTFVAYTLIGVPNALLFGFIAALGEAVPTVGPILAVLPPLLTTLATEPDKVVLLLFVTVAIHQLENQLLVPLLLGRTLKLHPVSVMAGVLGFSTAFGVLGAFLAVPSLIVIKTVYQGLSELESDSEPKLKLKDTQLEAPEAKLNFQKNEG
ncbi:MAG: AI-2E family transporter [Pseudopedobacter sp.]|nr:AI-2E family transporter [Deinococcales bacterium]